MLTFHWIELLVIVLAGLILLFQLALLMLRRRNEMLQTLLTPDSPEIEEDFFRVHPLSAEAAAEQEAVETEAVDTQPKAATTETNAESADAVHWGTQMNRDPDEDRGGL